MPVLSKKVLGRGALLLVMLVGIPLAAPVSAAHADQVRERQYWIADYGIDRAWSITRGAGVRIAIIDTGIDGSHQDLLGAVVGGTDVSGLGSSQGAATMAPMESSGARPRPSF